MALGSEGFEIEGALATTELGAQWRKAGGIDPSGTQYEAVRSLFQFQMIARLDPQRLQHLGREGDLSFSRALWGGFDFPTADDPQLLVIPSLRFSPFREASPFSLWPTLIHATNTYNCNANMWSQKMAGSTITIRTDPEISAKIAALAQAMDRSRNWVIEEALKQYIETQAWQIEGIKQAQASVARGEGVSFEDAMEEIEALIKEKIEERDDRR
jgi:predicted transcriptional regulator